MSQIEYTQTQEQWQQYQEQPWLRFNMTEDEWRTYEDEYADYLDTLEFTGNTLRDKITLQNAREQREHEQRRLAALAKIQAMRNKIATVSD